MTKTTDKPGVIQAAKAQVDGKLVHLTSRGARKAFGTMPLEWPMVDPATGKRAIDHDNKDRDGNVLEQVRYANLEWGHEGVVAFNPADRDDAELLRRTKDWLENSGDKRIARYGIDRCSLDGCCHGVDRHWPRQISAN